MAHDNDGMSELQRFCVRHERAPSRSDELRDVPGPELCEGRQVGEHLYNGQLWELARRHARRAWSVERGAWSVSRSVAQSLSALRSTLYALRSTLYALRVTTVRRARQ